MAETLGDNIMTIGLQTELENERKMNIKFLTDFFSKHTTRNKIIFYNKDEKISKEYLLTENDVARSRQTLSNLSESWQDQDVEIVRQRMEKAADERAAKLAAKRCCKT